MMNDRRLPQVLLASVLALTLGCEATGEFDYMDPEAVVQGGDLAAAYAEEDGWYVSPVLEAPTGTTRAAFLIELVPGARGTELGFEARGIGADGAGDWMPLSEIVQDEQFVNGHVELGFEAEGLQLRLPIEVASALAVLNLAAAHPERAAELDAPLDTDESALGSASQPLTSSEAAALGVSYRSRAAWGARPSRTCTSNPSKYRMAVHHTAGGASVSDAAVRAIQRYHQVDRGWCDIGYHYLVDRNGTVYQGRPIGLSGAHVGGNNTGNIGISLMGCYDSRDGICGKINRATGSSPTPSDAIIQSAGRLIGVMARSHGIAIDRSRIRGHGEHPGATTSCPGNQVLARFDTLLSIARSGGTSTQPQPEPEPTPACERDDLVFSDIGCSPHLADILWMAAEGLTNGCGDGRYCPAQPVTRGQMAVFMQRGFDLPAGPAVFSDVTGHPHEDAINAVAAAGITLGCGDGRFCPDDEVTRSQMAAFLARALNLPQADGALSDVPADLPHAPAIHSLMAVGISTGCAPDRYCPAGVVNRAQMAAFMHKAVDYLRANCHSPSGTFVDIGCSPFKADIEWMAASGITDGCGGLRYCPDRDVTRGELATFLYRALDLPSGPRVFSDVAGSPHQEGINAIAAAGITDGCGSGRFCPDTPVTRAQTATFLVRGYDLPPGPPVFSDVAGSPYAESIYALAAAGITNGCGDGRFCPDDNLGRAHMARFLYQAKSR